MYINDLPDGLNSTVRLFADDVLLYGTICCDEERADLQDDLYRLEDWEQKWKMGIKSFKVQDHVFYNQESSTKAGIRILWRNPRRSGIFPLSGGNAR